MEPDTCSFCKGEFCDGKTEFAARVRDTAVSRPIATGRRN